MGTYLITIYSALFILKKDAVMANSVTYLFPIYFRTFALYIQIKVAKCSTYLKNIFCKSKNVKPNAFANFSPKSIPQYILSKILQKTGGSNYYRFLGSGPNSKSNKQTDMIFSPKCWLQSC